MLAYRWGHRVSFDLDINVEKGFGTIGLYNDKDLQAAVAAAGGTADQGADSEHYQAVFGKGEEHKLEIWSDDPVITAGHRTERIEGREETVFSTAQILSGKIQRAHRGLARDIYDIVIAGRLAPEALTAAVNSVSPREADMISEIWRRQEATIARRARTPALTPTQGFEVDETELASQGRAALDGHRYKEMSIRAEKGVMSISVRTIAGDEYEWTTTPGRIQENLKRTGIARHIERITGEKNGQGWIRRIEYDTLKGRSGLLYREQWQDSGMGDVLMAIKDQPEPLTELEEQMLAHAESELRSTEEHGTETTREQRQRMPGMERRITSPTR